MLVTAALAGSSVTASVRQYLKKSEVFCDVSNTICLDGTIYYLANDRILGIRARIQKQTGPGTIALDFSGENRQGHVKRTELLVDVRGKASEIVHKDFRPDAPDVNSWQLTAFTFRPASD